MGKGLAMKRDGLGRTNKAWRRARAVALLATAAVALSACGGGGAREMLGLNKKAPDEFAVVPRAPLSMPPNFNLRPPRPGEPRPQEEAPKVTAQRAVFGSAAASDGGAGGRDRGETVLLARAGADKADPNIRRVIEEESSTLAQRDESFVDDLIFWQDKQTPGTVIDARKEARRIQEAQATGAPVNEGEVPVIERKKRGWLEGIF